MDVDDDKSLVEQLAAALANFPEQSSLLSLGNLMPAKFTANMCEDNSEACRCVLKVLDNNGLLKSPAGSVLEAAIVMRFGSLADAGCFV